MTVALAACPDCDTARARSIATGMVYVCTCDRRYRPPVRTLYLAPEGDTPAPSALARAGHAAARLTVDDPELARVRRVLADLRPDCADPMEPPPRAAEMPALTVRIHDPSASWGGIPRGLESGMGAMLDHAAEMRSRCLADVLREVSALAPDAAAVLRWMRAHATLRDGLRGLFVDAGMMFASTAQTAAWEDLSARRIGAPTHGRRLILRACDAWERRTPAHPAP